jgi:hypothetical protein
MRVTPNSVSRLEAVGYRVVRIIELANGPDEPPEPKLVDLPPWPGHVAHVAWPHDGAILLMPEVYQPADAVDLRCGHCVATPVIAFDQLDRRLIFLINHARGCPAVDDLMTLAGVL